MVSNLPHETMYYVLKKLLREERKICFSTEVKRGNSSVPCRHEGMGSKDIYDCPKCKKVVFRNHIIYIQEEDVIAEKLVVEEVNAEVEARQKEREIA